MNQKTASIWGFILYTDFFLGALGGGLLVLGSLATLFFDPGMVNAVPFIAAVAVMGIGTALLVIELGVPIKAWRVFTNPRSFLMIGASLMTASMGLALLLASFYLPGLPWRHSSSLQNIIALLAASTGFGVAFYPGLLLGGMTGRPFWKGPLLAPLFLLSGLSTGAAFYCLLGLIWPVSQQAAYWFLKSMNLFLLVIQIIGWTTYLFIKKAQCPPRELISWKAVFAGQRNLVFWIGFVGFGLVVPFVLYLLPIELFTTFAHCFVLFGALIMRGFVVTADRGVSLGF